MELRIGAQALQRGRNGASVTSCEHPRYAKSYMGIDGHPTSPHGLGINL